MATMFFFLPCLEPGAPRTLDMRLLGWGLGQSFLVLGPAEHEAENITRFGGQVVTFSCMAITGNQEMHTRHGQPSQQILVEQGSVWPRLHLVGPGSTEEGGNTTLHNTPGSSGEALLRFSGAWVSCQGCGASCWIGQKMLRA